MLCVHITNDCYCVCAFDVCVENMYLIVLLELLLFSFLSFVAWLNEIFRYMSFNNENKIDESEFNFSKVVYGLVYVLIDTFISDEIIRLWIT